jgi:hypothetical protein
VTWIPAGLVVVGCCYNLMSSHGKHLRSSARFPVT